MAEPLVTIIIPCRFKPEITQVCIDSIIKYTKNFKIICIQDGEDDVMDSLLNSYWKHEIDEKIYHKEPQGWIKSINEGMELVDKNSKYVMFLNDDVVVVPGWLEGMLKYFDKIKDLGVVGCVSSKAQGRQNVDYNITKDLGFEEIDQLMGFCMLFKKEVLNKLKSKDNFYLDERFGLGGQDDVDICWRAKGLGYKIGIARDVFIYHYGSKAFREILITPEESRKYAQSRQDILEKKYQIQSKNMLTSESSISTKKPKILICIPSIRGTLVIPLVHVLLAWKQDPRYDVTLYTPMNLFPLDNARNRCVKEFLEMDYDYLFFIDDDIVPPLDALHKLISSDKDIIGAVAFSMRSEDGLDFPYPVTLKYNENKEYILFIPKPATGIHEVDATGGASILYKRRVFEHPMMECPYSFKYHRDGTLALTCDFVVHQKAQAAGFKIYIDFDLLCSHIREVDIKSINNLMVSKKQ
ncbi:MAG: glycosyltransferase [Nanoarchaeota archaeon]